MANSTLGTGALLLGSLLIGTVLASPIASQTGTTSKPDTPDFQERQRRAKALKQARRWVTFLELDSKRAEGANGLLRLGKDAVPALVQALNDPRPIVVQRVAHILRALGSQAAAAKPKLVALSNSKDPKLANAARYALGGIQTGNITLVADFGAHQVLELNKAGKVVRRLKGVNGPWDAERLPNGNYLICGYSANKVVEMTAKGKVVWSYNTRSSAYKAQRLPNGNTFISDGSGRRVLEVNRAGKIVWKYDKGKIQPYDAERLVNGNTLIADAAGKRIIEVTPKGEIIWEHKHGQHVMDADRLPNGNTLISLSRLSKVIEVSPKGQVVVTLKVHSNPVDADRLPNGNTLVAHQNEVSEYDPKGKKVWSAKVGRAGEVNRY